MLGGIILDRVDSITDLGVVMNSRMSFSKHIDVSVGKGFGNAGVCEKYVGEFRDLYALRTLYVSVVRPKLEYVSCVWRPFYVLHISKIERVQ
jgi:hypothetical protein